MNQLSTSPLLKLQNFVSAKAAVHNQAGTSSVATRRTRNTTSSRSSKLAKMLPKMAFILVSGMSVWSAHAVTIDQVINDMTATSEAMVIDPRYEWQSKPVIQMYAPRGDAIPSWWPGNRPEWCYNTLTWYTAYEAQGNGATNTRVQIANLRLYVLSESTRKWTLVDTQASPVSNLWKYPFDFAADSPSARSESSGGMSIKPKYPYFHHGYGNSRNIVPQDVRATFVAMEFRLVVDDPSKPDDRAAAKYVVDTGADYYPGNGQGDWGVGYAPAMGNSRMLLATSNWRTASLLVPNTRNGATFAEMKSNPPPGVDAAGVVTTTTAAATTTTRAATTTTAAATTTTKAATTTTGVLTTTTGSTTTTTLSSGAINTGTSSTPLSTSAYTAPTAKHSGKCIDVSAWSTANGGAIVQYGCHGGDNQKWALRDMGGAQYQVISRSSGKCLDTTGSTANGATVLQYDCTNSPRQLWTRRLSNTGHAQLVSVGSGKCLNVRGYSSADGAVIEQNACTNSDSQMWSLPVATPQALIAKHSGKCVDLEGWSTANGTVMQQWACNGGTNQQWLFKDNGNARYQVISRASGKCVEVKDGSLVDGAAVQQSDCQAGASKQLWTFQPEAGGYNKLKSVASGKCMDVVAVQTTDGAKLHQWNCSISGGDNQRWMIK